MAAAYRDLAIRAGITCEFVVDVVGGPATLDGYSGAMQIRELRNDILPIAEVPADAITVNGSTRQVTVRIPGTASASWSWVRGVYDLRIDGPLGDWLLVEGRATNSPAVTRED